MNKLVRNQTRYLAFAFLIFALALAMVFAQEQPPAPSAPKTVSIPAVQERKLPNGLTVAVIERKSNPLVTVQLLVKAGASVEDESKAGLADMTANLLTKGTKTRSATQIAEEMAFLGSELNSGAGWNSSTVSFTATPDKLAAALAVMSDVVLSPAFSQDELDLLKSQTLDEVKYNLKQPSFIANYVASKYSFGEHPAGGTPVTLAAISRNDVDNFHKSEYVPEQSILIFAGDITLPQAVSLAATAFGKWGGPVTGRKELIQNIMEAPSSAPEKVIGPTARKILVVDLPKSGQAAVTVVKSIPVGRLDLAPDLKSEVINKQYFPAIVLNSVLGGGYSSRLNYEIRIKRGLSYGASSSLAWRWDSSNFSGRAQTKSESAAEVATLVLDEIDNLVKGDVKNEELIPRKSVLTGNFDRNLETTSGLANALADLYTFAIPARELNRYSASVNSVTGAQIREFASQNLSNGDLIIVGDYAEFKDDLAKRFPGIKVDVIAVDDLDLSKGGLRK